MSSQYSQSPLMMPLLESPISLVSTRPVAALTSRRRGSHPFDSLPWIDLVNSPNVGGECDLSQLGPVRRRRKVRSSPLSRPRRLPSSSPAPTLPVSLLGRCSTPPPPPPASYIIFDDLMPHRN
ncbi:uncharacterized protein BT62DRAFT_998654 [Guyanagaster necrorhizus]|uniref:Uncharacterized protein n=1 Tax=Guyanagaster necrorhizus TaxID=856835 RepID=A0A9P8AYG5_9AGAR|nr:uncharacterized protein BT62DRAFT_998654 [Guyanagaster necrorhizus MCA 3950]KAG7452628.1 hypothetical protein BT62DRAFT_998654 [Guyanagaster necrorhizus MCA 3950]